MSKGYKGGRTKRLPEGRCTPEFLIKLKQILADRELSYADWVVLALKREKGGV